MTIPSYDKFMLPILRIAGDGKEHTTEEIDDSMVKEFSITQLDLSQRNESGQSTFRNRVAWGRTFLKKAGLLEATGIGRFRITKDGNRVLRERPPAITLNYLLRFPSFREFRTPRSKGRNVVENDQPSEEIQTPEEILAANYEKYNSRLCEDLLDRIKSCSPEFFEDLVVDLLAAMDYGDAKSVGRTGDGGIDGIIKQDRLGLDAIFVQAKRWQGTVPAKEIRAFAGSLELQKATKGVFITTSDFSDEARKHAEALGKRIVLIDGGKLAQYLIDYGIGVTEQVRYSIKKMDLDYFPAKG